MRRRAMLIALAALGIGCADGGGDQAGLATLELVEVARYGWADMPADTAALPAGHQRLGGGVLGEPDAVVQAPDSTIYVLDGLYKKIAAFAPGGELLGVVAGGEGAGPGEFTAPTDLAWAEPGRLVVLDYQLGRVTTFSREGVTLGTWSTGGTRYRLAVRGDTVWTTRAAFDGFAESLGDRWLAAGTRIDSLPAANAEDVPFGGGVYIASCPDGRTLLRINRPGVWLEHDGGEWTRRGSPLYPAIPPPIIERSGGSVSVFGGQLEARQLACLPSGDVLQLHSRYVEAPDPEADSLPPLEYFIVRFTADGVPVAARKLDDSSFAYGPFYVSPVTGRLFATRDVPWPVVVEYDLEAGGAFEGLRVE